MWIIALLIIVGFVAFIINKDHKENVKQTSSIKEACWASMDRL